MPLADVMVLNLDHYRLDADYKHGLHFTALPTAWVAGFDKRDAGDFRRAAAAAELGGPVRLAQPAARQNCPANETGWK